MSPTLIVCALIGLCGIAFSLVCWVMATRRIKRHKRAIEAHFRKDMRQGELQFARAIAEEGLTGDRRHKTLARIAAAEKQTNQS